MLPLIASAHAPPAEQTVIILQTTVTAGSPRCTSTSGRGEGGGAGGSRGRLEKLLARHWTQRARHQK